MKKSKALFGLGIALGAISLGGFVACATPAKAIDPSKDDFQELSAFIKNMQTQFALNDDSTVNKLADPKISSMADLEKYLSQSFHLPKGMQGRNFQVSPMDDNGQATVNFELVLGSASTKVSFKIEGFATKTAREKDQNEKLVIENADKIIQNLNAAIKDSIEVNNATNNAMTLQQVMNALDKEINELKDTYTTMDLSLGRLLDDGTIHAVLTVKRGEGETQGVTRRNITLTGFPTKVERDRADNLEAIKNYLMQISQAESTLREGQDTMHKPSDSLNTLDDLNNLINPQDAILAPTDSSISVSVEWETLDDNGNLNLLLRASKGEGEIHAESTKSFIIRGFATKAVRDQAANQAAVDSYLASLENASLTLKDGLDKRSKPEGNINTLEALNALMNTPLSVPQDNQIVTSVSLGNLLDDGTIKITLNASKGDGEIQGSKFLELIWSGFFTLQERRQLENQQAVDAFVSSITNLNRNLKTGIDKSSKPSLEINTLADLNQLLSNEITLPSDSAIASAVTLGNLLDDGTIKVTLVISKGESDVLGTKTLELTLNGFFTLNERTKILNQAAVDAYQKTLNNLSLSRAEGIDYQNVFSQGINTLSDLNKILVTQINLPQDDLISTKVTLGTLDDQGVLAFTLKISKGEESKQTLATTSINLAINGFKTKAEREQIANHLALVNYANSISKTTRDLAQGIDPFVKPSLKIETLEDLNKLLSEDILASEDPQITFSVTLRELKDDGTISLNLTFTKGEKAQGTFASLDKVLTLQGFKTLDERVQKDNLAILEEFAKSMGAFFGQDVTEDSQGNYVVDTKNLNLYELMKALSTEGIDIHVSTSLPTDEGTSEMTFVFTKGQGNRQASHREVIKITGLPTLVEREQAANSKVIDAYFASLENQVWAIKATVSKEVTPTLSDSSLSSLNAILTTAITPPNDSASTLNVQIGALDDDGNVSVTLEMARGAGQSRVTKTHTISLSGFYTKVIRDQIVLDHATLVTINQGFQNLGTLTVLDQEKNTVPNVHNLAELNNLLTGTPFIINDQAVQISFEEASAITQEGVVSWKILLTKGHATLESQIAIHGFVFPEDAQRLHAFLNTLEGKLGSANSPLSILDTEISKSATSITSLEELNKLLAPEKQIHRPEDETPQSLTITFSNFHLEGNNSQGSVQVSFQKGAAELTRVIYLDGFYTTNEREQKANQEAVNDYLSSVDGLSKEINTDVSKDHLPVINNLTDLNNLLKTPLSLTSSTEGINLILKATKLEDDGTLKVTFVASKGETEATLATAQAVLTLNGFNPSELREQHANMQALNDYLDTMKDTPLSLNNTVDLSQKPEGQHSTMAQLNTLLVTPLSLPSETSGISMEVSLGDLQDDGTIIVTLKASKGQNGTLAQASMNLTLSGFNTLETNTQIANQSEVTSYLNSLDLSNLSINSQTSKDVLPSPAVTTLSQLNNLLTSSLSEPETTSNIEVTITLLRLNDDGTVSAKISATKEQEGTTLGSFKKDFLLHGFSTKDERDLQANNQAVITYYNTLKDAPKVLKGSVNKDKKPEGSFTTLEELNDLFENPLTLPSLDSGISLSLSLGELQDEGALVVNLTFEKGTGVSHVSVQKILSISGFSTKNVRLQEENQASVDAYLNGFDFSDLRLKTSVNEDALPSPAITTLDALNALLATPLTSSADSTNIDLNVSLGELQDDGSVAITFVATKGDLPETLATSRKFFNLSGFATKLMRDQKDVDDYRNALSNLNLTLKDTFQNKELPEGSFSTLSNLNTLLVNEINAPTSASRINVSLAFSALQSDGSISITFTITKGQANAQPLSLNLSGFITQDAKDQALNQQVVATYANSLNLSNLVLKEGEDKSQKPILSAHTLEALNTILDTQSQIRLPLEANQISVLVTLLEIDQDGILSGTLVITKGAQNTLGRISKDFTISGFNSEIENKKLANQKAVDDYLLTLDLTSIAIKDSVDKSQKPTPEVTTLSALKDLLNAPLNLDESAFNFSVSLGELASNGTIEVTLNVAKGSDQTVGNGTKKFFLHGFKTAAQLEEDANALVINNAINELKLLNLQVQETHATGLALDTNLATLKTLLQGNALEATLTKYPQLNVSVNGIEALQDSQQIVHLSLSKGDPANNTLSTKTYDLIIHGFKSAAQIEHDNNLQAIRSYIQSLNLQDNQIHTGEGKNHKPVNITNLDQLNEIVTTPIEVSADPLINVSVSLGDLSDTGTLVVTLVISKGTPQEVSYASQIATFTLSGFNEKNVREYNANQTSVNSLSNELKNLTLSINSIVQNAIPNGTSFNALKAMLAGEELERVLSKYPGVEVAIVSIDALSGTSQVVHITISKGLEAENTFYSTTSTLTISGFKTSVEMEQIANQNALNNYFESLDLTNVVVDSSSTDLYQKPSQTITTLEDLNTLLSHNISAPSVESGITFSVTSLSDLNDQGTLDVTFRISKGAGSSAAQLDKTFVLHGFKTKAERDHQANQTLVEDAIQRLETLNLNIDPNNIHEIPQGTDFAALKTLLAGNDLEAILIDYSSLQVSVASIENLANNQQIVHLTLSKGSQVDNTFYQNSLALEISGFSNPNQSIIENAKNALQAIPASDLFVKDPYTNSSRGIATNANFTQVEDYLNASPISTALNAYAGVSVEVVILGTYNSTGDGSQDVNLKITKGIGANKAEATLTLSLTGFNTLDGERERISALFANRENSFKVATYEDTDLVSFESLNALLKEPVDLKSNIIYHLMSPITKVANGFSVRIQYQSRSNPETFFSGRAFVIKGSIAPTHPTRDLVYRTDFEVVANSYSSYPISNVFDKSESSYWYLNSDNTRDMFFRINFKNGAKSLKEINLLQVRGTANTYTTPPEGIELILTKEDGTLQVIQGTERANGSTAQLSKFVISGSDRYSNLVIKFKKGQRPTNFWSSRYISIANLELIGN